MRSNTRVAGPTELARDARVENLTPDLVLVCPETRETQLARVDRKAIQMSNRADPGPVRRVRLPAGRIVVMIAILAAVAFPLLGHAKLTETRLSVQQVAQPPATRPHAVPRSAGASSRKVSSGSPALDAPHGSRSGRVRPPHPVGSNVASHGTNRVAAVPAPRGTAPIRARSDTAPLGAAPQQVPRHRTKAPDAVRVAIGAAAAEEEEEEEHEPIGIPGLTAAHGAVPGARCRHARDRAAVVVLGSYCERPPLPPATLPRDARGIRGCNGRAKREPAP